MNTELNTSVCSSALYFQQKLIRLAHEQVNTNQMYMEYSMDTDTNRLTHMMLSDLDTNMLFAQIIHITWDKKYNKYQLEINVTGAKDERVIYYLTLQELTSFLQDQNIL